MKAKIKGSQAERELIHMFWKTNKWTACRVAGSGSMKYPSPDIIANKEGVNLAIECKITSSKYQYFEEKEIQELLEYAKKAGARPLVAVKFSKKPWAFLDAAELRKTKESYVLTNEVLDYKGLSFDDITKDL